jgi:hypothetical protein
MCVVIDTCCLISVFDRGNEDHMAFAPVLEWINSGKGRMIYGGTKYKAELAKVKRMLPILVELRRAQRATNVDDSRVDQIEKELITNFVDPKFNDQHLVAVVIVSRCRVVCTLDKVATAYLKRADLFRTYRVKRPKIYRSRRNKNLCCDRNLI